MEKYNQSSLVPLFHEDLSKKFFVKITSEDRCVLMPQDKISEALTNKTFLYSKETAEEAESLYKEKYPENIL